MRTAAWFLGLGAAHFALYVPLAGPGTPIEWAAVAGAAALMSAGTLLATRRRRTAD